MTVHDEDIATGIGDDVAWGGEVVRPITRDPSLAQGHEEIALGGKLEDLMSKHRAPRLRRLLSSTPCFGHPDVAVAVYVDPMGATRTCGSRTSSPRFRPDRT